MKATVVDLRYKMNDVLKALDRNERVTVFYRGKMKGILISSEQPGKEKKISAHPFFGMHSAGDGKSVAAEIEQLRKGRYDDI